MLNSRDELFKTERLVRNLDGCKICDIPMIRIKKETAIALAKVIILSMNPESKDAWIVKREV